MNTPGASVLWGQVDVFRRLYTTRGLPRSKMVRVMVLGRLLQDETLVVEQGEASTVVNQRLRSDTLGTGPYPSNTA